MVARPKTRLVALTRPYAASEEEQAWLSGLVAQTGMPVAALRHRGQTVLATGDLHPQRPWTPLVDLIQGLRAAEAHADLWLRNRIFVSYPLCDAERATVQVAAQRVTSVVPWETAPAPGSWRDVTPHARRARLQAMQHMPSAPAMLPDDEAATMAYATSLAVASVETGVPTRHRHRGIAALWHAPNRPVCATINLGGTNRMAHAELLLLQTWWLREGRPMPASGRWFVTLSPCRMCAAWILRATESPGPSEVVCGRLDGGRLGRDTVLAPRLRIV